MEYFIPGFIFLGLFYYFTSRKSSSYFIIGCVVVSYILKAIFSVLHTKIFVAKYFTSSERAIILSTIALILSLITVWFSEQKSINDMITKINHKSIHDDIWQDIIDYKNGTTLRMVCDDATYTGILLFHEEKGLDSWFVLDNYVIEENDKTFISDRITLPSKIAINLKTVKRIELYYGGVIDSHKKQ